jgi:predicted DNA-binding helix-hairpin-helix protein
MSYNKDKRKNDVSAILKLYKEPDVPDKLINKIRELYPTIKYYDYIHTEEIIEGDVIQTVSIDLKKLSIPAKCINIEYSKNKTIKNILLVNNKADVFWRIKPTKYYIFRLVSDKNALFREYMEKISFKK